MTIYEELGVVPVIDAAGTYTVVGGSRMSEETIRCIGEAASQHVEIPELQTAVQNKIAEMTRNESSVICNGAASGLYLCAVSAIAKKLGKKAKYLSNEEIADCEVLSMNAHHIPYDYAVKQLGVGLRSVGYPNIEGSMDKDDLESGINKHTAAIYYFISSPYGIKTPGALPLEDVIEIGEQYKLPVIVDAAAQLPPVENLWKLTGMGASAVIFSGGKSLRGPQSSGLIVGKKEFLKIVQETNFPNYGFGRMLKTGREEIVGLYSAIKQYLAMDHEEMDRFAERCVSAVLNAFGESELFHVERLFPNEAAQPMAFVKITAKDSLDLEDVVRRMKDGQPSVFIKPEGECFFINPMTLKDGEVLPVIEKLKQVEKSILEER